MMEFLYFLLWLIVALSAAFALVWLGLLFQSAKKALDQTISEIIPVIRKIDESVSIINSELERMDSAISKINNISKKISEITEAAERTLRPVTSKVGAVASGISKALSTILKGK
jgi:phage-related protein